jgi:SAM-dependent methyltransferase
MNYFEALQLVKSTFLDGSEKSIVIDCIAKHFKDESLRILDVGIGDGRYIGKIITELDRAGISATVTGIDPSPASERVVSKFFPAFKVEPRRFEDYDTNAVFDIVIATHSLYYVNQAYQCLDKMVKLTRKGGLTIIVLWSELCVLYKLYKLYKERCKLNGGNGFVTIEKAFEHVDSLNDLKGVQLKHFHGRIVLSHWRSLPGILDSACMLFSRDVGLQKIHKIHKEHIDGLQNALNHFGDIEQRVNGIIFVYR